MIKGGCGGKNKERYGVQSGSKPNRKTRGCEQKGGRCYFGICQSQGIPVGKAEKSEFEKGKGVRYGKDKIVYRNKDDGIDA